MFDKKKFSEILKTIYSNYENQRAFASSTGVNRGYLSRYINMKITNPPSPKILKNIANASKGITTYNELMHICGYEEMTDEYNLLLTGDIRYADLYFQGQNLNKETKIKEIRKLIENLENYIKACLLIIEANNDNKFGECYITIYKSCMERAKKEEKGFMKLVENLERW